MAPRSSSMSNYLDNWLIMKRWTLGLRPEHIFTTSNDCRAFQNQQTCTLPQVNLKTTITNLEMLGSEFLIHTELEHNRFKIPA